MSCIWISIFLPPISGTLRLSVADMFFEDIVSSCSAVITFFSFISGQYKSVITWLISQGCRSSVSSECLLFVYQSQSSTTISSPSEPHFLLSDICNRLSSLYLFKHSHPAVSLPVFRFPSHIHVSHQCICVWMWGRGGLILPCCQKHTDKHTFL